MFCVKSNGFNSRLQGYDIIFYMRKLIYLIPVVIAAIFIYLITARTAMPGYEKYRTIDRSIKDHYTISAEYPKFSGFKEEASEKSLNNEISAFVTKTIEEFKKSATEAYTSSSEQLSTLNIRYGVPLITNKVASIEFLISTYISGAAHPNNYEMSINYDLGANKHIQLGDLFIGDEYLKKLSAIAIESLKTKLGADTDTRWIKEGASPKAENYQVFLITPDSFVVVFNPYQVAAYAAGQQKVVFRLDQIKEFVNPSGPLARIK